jgi:mannose-1-phosphate guanylyltransferase
LLKKSYVFYRPSNESDLKNRCAVVLAGGDGVRLRPFVKRLRGDALPKQYVSLFGGRSMLQAAISRAQRLIPRERIFVVVQQSHFQFAEVARQLVAEPDVHVVIQPSNRGTAIGLMLPLAHVVERCPESTVAVFPSDHFVSNDDLFAAHIDAAFGIVEQDGEKIVLIGVRPLGADPDYGYVVADDESPNGFPCGARLVSGFIEKPPPGLAQEIVGRGGLWNTLVVVFKARNFLSCLSAINARLYECFQRIRAARRGPGLSRTIEKIYTEAQPINLSTGVLEELPRRFPSQLLVLPLRGVYWCDCGSEVRLARVLSCTAGAETAFGGISASSPNRKLKPAV